MVTVKNKNKKGIKQIIILYTEEKNKHTITAR